MYIETQHPLIEEMLSDWKDRIGDDYAGYRGHVYPKCERPSIIWITVSRAGNTFLHQQDALFLLDLEADSRSPRPPELEAAILDAPSRAGLPTPSEPQIVKLLLPQLEAASESELYHLFNVLDAN